MEFKYAMNGEDGDLFEDGVVLARQFLGVGRWEVWDLRPNPAKLCNECSSKAERIVCHESLCPKAAQNANLGENRAVRAREAIAKRADRNAANKAAAGEAASAAGTASSTPAASDDDWVEQDAVDSARKRVTKRAARKGPQKRARAAEEAIEEAVEEDEAVEQEDAVEQDAAEEMSGKEEAGEARDKAGAGEPATARDKQRAPHEHEVVHERLIQEYVSKNNKRPSDAIWYTLLEKARVEVASKTEGKRRHIHKRLPDGVVPTWAGHF